MRITGGILRSRVLRVPRADVRPTQDRVREALFSSLGEHVAHARVLDLYAGSGALGLEAWSRGADYVCWVEGNRDVFRTLKQNVETLCPEEEGLRLVQCDAERFLRESQREKEGYDLIMADPPYDLSRSGELAQNTLRSIQRHSMLRPNGVVVIEQRKDAEVPDVLGWKSLAQRRYGRTSLLYYARTSGEEAT